MAALAEVAVALAFTFMIVKSYAVLWSFWRVAAVGNGLALALREKAPQAVIDTELRELRPVGTFLHDLPNPVGKVAATLFRGPIAISIAAAISLATASDTHVHPSLMLALGIATAVCSLLHLVSALIWRLAFGRQAYRLFDVRIPALKAIKEWAVIYEPGQNLIPYFLAMVYISVLGFAALYVGIVAFDQYAFVVRGSHSALTWVYFSLTTIATVGDSRVAAASSGAESAVIAQLATGPLLLSWLVAQATPFSGTEAGGSFSQAGGMRE